MDNHCTLVISPSDWCDVIQYRWPRPTHGEYSNITVEAWGHQNEAEEANIVMCVPVWPECCHVKNKFLFQQSLITSWKSISYRQKSALTEHLLSTTIIHVTLCKAIGLCWCNITLEEFVRTSSSIYDFVKCSDMHN